MHVIARVFEIHCLQLCIYPYCASVLGNSARSMRAYSAVSRTRINWFPLKYKENIFLSVIWWWTLAGHFCSLHLFHIRSLQAIRHASIILESANTRQSFSCIFRWLPGKCNKRYFQCLSAVWKLNQMQIFYVVLNGPGLHLRGHFNYSLGEED